MFIYIIIKVVQKVTTSYVIVLYFVAQDFEISWGSFVTRTDDKKEL